MVAYSDDARADALFHALADGTRRDIVRRALAKPLTISSLAEPYGMSFQAVQKHVAVLQRAGLVTKEARGRRRLVRTDVRSLREAMRYLDELEVVWRSRVEQMDRVLAEEDAHATTDGEDEPCP